VQPKLVHLSFFLNSFDIGTEITDPTKFSEILALKKSLIISLDLMFPPKRLENILVVCQQLGNALVCFVQLYKDTQDWLTSKEERFISCSSREWKV
jgi:hypothetical protein